jgi:hypothetical protein
MWLSGVGLLRSKVLMDRRQLLADMDAESTSAVKSDDFMAYFTR